MQNSMLQQQKTIREYKKKLEDYRLGRITKNVEKVA